MTERTALSTTSEERPGGELGWIKGTEVIREGIQKRSSTRPGRSRKFIGGENVRRGA